MLVKHTTEQTLIMKTKLEKRLKKLKEEFQSGQAVLRGLDVKRDNVRQTLMRISGAGRRIRH